MNGHTGMCPRPSSAVPSNLINLREENGLHLGSSIWLATSWLLVSPRVLGRQVLHLRLPDTLPRNTQGAYAGSSSH